MNHPLFQRLRFIRQNDVAGFVYPSLNVTRFEHSVGTAHVAGKMALSLIQSPKWPEYASFSGFSKIQFVKICRLYALLHDIGHFPLSHLFERALKEYYKDLKQESDKYAICKDLFKKEGYKQPHEAFGSIIGPKILSDSTSKFEEETAVVNSVEKLLTNKKLPEEDPLFPVKVLVDSEIDADRIDSVARDGLLAGGDYGSYDISRLCASVFLYCNNGNKWNLTFSHKALSSIEGLLLDRLRVHNWVHFHHRVIALKVAAIETIKGLLKVPGKTGLKYEIKNNIRDFSLLEKMYFDDVWLFSKIRNWEPVEKASVLARQAILNRDTSKFRPLWKDRISFWENFEKFKDKVVEKAEAMGKRISKEFKEKFPTVMSWNLSHGFDEKLSSTFGTPVRNYVIEFNPLSERRLHITTDDGLTVDANNELLSSSKLISFLNEIWDKETFIYPVVFSDNVAQRNQKQDQQLWINTIAVG